MIVDAREIRAEISRLMAQGRVTVEPELSEEAQAEIVRDTYNAARVEREAERRECPPAPKVKLPMPPPWPCHGPGCANIVTPTRRESPQRFCSKKCAQQAMRGTPKKYSSSHQSKCGVKPKPYAIGEDSDGHTRATISAARGKRISNRER